MKIRYLKFLEGKPVKKSREIYPKSITQYLDLKKIRNEEFNDYVNEENKE